MGFSAVICPSSLVSNVAHSIVAYFCQCGSRVYDGAPFSATGEFELYTIQKILIYPPIIGPKPDRLAAYETWQYNSEAHASLRKPILGSVEILVNTDAGLYVSFEHLVKRLIWRGDRPQHYSLMHN